MEELKVKVVEVSQEKEQPQGNDYMRVTVEIDGRKIEGETVKELK